MTWPIRLATGVILLALGGRDAEAEVTEMIKIPVRQRAMMVQSMLLMPILLLAQKDRWNYLLVFNWDLNKNWCVMAEAGFGGSRENFIGGVTYPF